MMKNIFKGLVLVFVAALFLASCDKATDLTYYDDGNAPALTASATTAAPALADSNKTVVSFSWTSPNYGSDSATYKYIVQIDSAGKNFSNSLITKTLTATRSFSLTGAEVTKMIVDAGYGYNTLYHFDVRVKSSYANNNELLISNLVRVKMSAYVTPPKVRVPVTGRLFIVGDATQGLWGTPVPTPLQEFGKVDSVTYVGVFNMNAGKEFLVLPENNFDNKYALENNSLPGISTGGDFGFNANGMFGQNFKGPLTAGMFKITLDFQRGKFTIVPYVGAQIPSNLYIIGNATPGGDVTGWDNPVPAPSQQFTKINSVQFVLNSLALNGGKQYLLLPVNGDWSNKYAVTGAAGINPAGDFFGYNSPDNFPAPTVSGNYKMEINFGIQKTGATGEVANTAKFKNTKL